MIDKKQKTREQIAKLSAKSNAETINTKKTLVNCHWKWLTQSVEQTLNFWCHLFWHGILYKRIMFDISHPLIQPVHSIQGEQLSSRTSSLD